MKKSRYIIIFLLLVTLFQSVLLTTSFGAEVTDSSQSQVNSATISVNSPSYVLMESSTGKILAQKSANQVRYPASTTKMMTAILALENCQLSDVATVSHNAIFSIPADYVISNLREGEKLTIEQLLNVLLIPSANDAAIVLAEHVSGSVSKFADLMNEKAKEIGCQHTNFVNPNGIHNKNHTSTAYDLALIAQYAMKNPTFREIIKKTKCSLPKTNKYNKEDRVFYTTNDLLVKNTSKAKSNYYYPNAIGIKTGYTGEAGNCLVSAAKKNDTEVISVVLGAGTTKEGLSEKFLDSITLLNYAFDNYETKTIYKKDDVLKEVQVSGATKETKDLKVLIKDDIKIFLEKNADINTLQCDVSLEKLKAPITTGSVVGSINYTVDGRTYTSELIAGSDVLPSNFFPILFRILLIIVTLYLISALLRSGKNGKNKRLRSNKNTKSSKYSKNRKRTGKYLYTINKL